jgi:NADPH:quinone reductase-like Zn-dependent oxidoreductase
LGAEDVIDYTQEDILQSGQTFDLVFDAVGKLSASEAKSLLSKNGSYLTVRTPTKELLEDLITLKSLFEEGKVKSVIDRRYPLAKVPEAHRNVETGRKRGNIVIMISDYESGVKK